MNHPGQPHVLQLSKQPRWRASLHGSCTLTFRGFFHTQVCGPNMPQLLFFCNSPRYMKVRVVALAQKADDPTVVWLEAKLKKGILEEFFCIAYYQVKSHEQPIRVKSPHLQRVTQKNHNGQTQIQTQQNKSYYHALSCHFLQNACSRWVAPKSSKRAMLYKCHGKREFCHVARVFKKGCGWGICHVLVCIASRCQTVRLSNQFYSF